MDTIEGALLLRIFKSNPFATSLESKAPIANGYPNRFEHEMDLFSQHFRSREQRQVFTIRKRICATRSGPHSKPFVFSNARWIPPLIERE